MKKLIVFTGLMIILVLLFACSDRPTYIDDTIDVRNCLRC